MSEGKDPHEQRLGTLRRWVWTGSEDATPITVRTVAIKAPGGTPPVTGKRTILDPGATRLLTLAPVVPNG